MKKVIINLFVLFSLTNICFGDIIINEFGAATSDRILKYSADGTPSVGSGISWTELQFDDSSWSSGPGGFGFGVGGLGTDLQSQLQYKTVSLYIRQKFIVSAADAAKTDDLRLEVDYDDGFIAFVNGKEIGRKNMGPGNSLGYHDQNAYNGHGSGTPEDVYFSSANDVLVEGTNVIAIQVHNRFSDNAMGISAELYIDSSPEVHLVNNSDDWNYFVGLCEPSGGLTDPRLLNPPALFVEWGSATFDDSSWSEGPGGLGYADGDDATIVNIQNVAYSLYIRRSFLVNTATASRNDPLEFTVDYDDGFIAYLNGYEIARRNMGSAGEFFAHNQSSTADHEAGTPEVITLAAASELLIEGTNVLAIQTHNASFGSSDMSMIADLKVTDSPEVVLVNHANNWKYFIGTAEPCPLPDEQAVIDDDFVDWLELYNNGSTSVSLKGWALTDDNKEINKWIFPDVSIGAGEYLLVFCDGANITSSPDSSLHTNFKLTKDGEYLALLKSGIFQQFISEFAPEYPRQSFFHSYGWNSDSNSYLYFSNSTPGKQNSGETFPGIVAEPIVDKTPGFYSPNVIVSITSATQNAEIRYTTNGSEPTETSALYSTPLTLNFNTALRVRAFKTGWIPSKTVTRTYLLNANNSIRDVPIVSLVADWEKSIFKPNGVTSIVGGEWDNPDPWLGNWSALTPDDYNILMQRGRPYERNISIEFLYYNTNLWSQIDCGFRTSGSDWSRPKYRLQDLSGKWKDVCVHVDKPQFNVYFRSDYGDSVLDFPLIPGSEVKKFDSLRLRAGKNDHINPFIIDEFLRRVFINMGQFGSKGFLAWLFVNGEQKAYFNPVERLDERFFQEWFDSNEEWDILNHGGVSEGDYTEWNKMIDYFNTHAMTSLSDYFGATQRLDLVNFIEYLMVETYAANWDWPHNNWYSARERSDNGVFRFYVWDIETSFYNGNAIDTDSFNRDNIGLNVSTWSQIAAVFRKLKVSAEFRLLFADRIQKHYFDNGCMEEPNLISEWNKLETIIAPMYSAFFGGSLDVRIRTDWIPQRRPYVFQQFKNEGFWPDTSAPFFNQQGGTVTSGFEVSISHTNSSGTIYFTTDGSDPRNFGGTVHGSSYSTPISLRHTTRVKARVLKNGEWSPLRESLFFVTGEHNIVVTEMMYHPLVGEEFEFIELKNISGAELNISDVSFVDGINFSFAGSVVTNLQIDEFVVVVKSNSAFASRYDTNDILIAGEYDGKLKNSGERIEIQGTGGETLLAYTFSDEWYPTTDEDGYSLVIVDAYANTNMWDKKEGWRPSYKINGSPGEELVESQPQIAADALIFPSADSIILASALTNIIWDSEKIIDEIDGTNLTISMMTLHYADTTNLITDITNNIANISGKIEWYVPPMAWEENTNYVLIFEVVDSSSSG